MLSPRRPGRTRATKTANGATTTLATILFMTLAVQYSSAATASIPSEIIDAVPSCATACVAAFVTANYPEAVCGTSPSFQCICQHKGANGFTVGEGALACMAFETKAGECTGSGSDSDDTSASASSAAYSMCANQTSAAAETHLTIVAADVLPSQFAALTTTVTTTLSRPTATTATTERTLTRSSKTTVTTTTTRTQSTSTSSSHSTESSSSTTTTQQTGSGTGTGTGAIAGTSSPSTSSSQAGATPGQDTDTDTDNDQTQLSVPQIVGIGVGTAAALIIAVAVYIGLRAVRRRRERRLPGIAGGRSSSNNNNNDTEGFRRLGDRKAGGHELQISAPVHLQPPRLLPQQQQLSPSFISPWHEKTTYVSNNINNTNNTNNNIHGPTRTVATAPLQVSSPIMVPDQALARPGGTASDGSHATNGLYRPYNPYSQRSPTKIGTSITNPGSNANNVNNSRAYEPYRGPSGRPRPPRVITDMPTNAPFQRKQSPGLSPRSGRPPATQRLPPQPQQPQPPTRNNFPATAVLPADWRPNAAVQPPPRSLNRPEPRPYPPYNGAGPQDAGLSTRSDSLARPPSNPYFGRPVINRDSIVTEFAEDGEDLSPRSGSGGRLPSTTDSLDQRLALNRRSSGQTSGQSYGLMYDPAGLASSRQPASPLAALPPARQARPADSRYKYSEDGNDSEDDDVMQQPFMSPTMVPKPLDVGARARPSPPRGGQSDFGGPAARGNSSFGNMSRVAQIRLGSNSTGRAPQRPQRPPQNPSWRQTDAEMGY